MTPSVRPRRDRPPTPALQRVLDDAAAPGYDAELAGLHDAVLAFATTSHTPVRAVSWSLAKLVAAPIAALVAVTSLGGGVALAAATGNLPDAVQNLAGKLGAPAPGERADKGADDLQAHRPDTRATPTRVGQGRCIAITRGGKDTRGTALQSAPLAAAVAEGCPASAVPGSQRSRTAKGEVADKAVKPAPATKTGTAHKPAGQPGTTVKPGTTAPADEPAKTVKTAPADSPDAAPGPSGGVSTERSARARQAPKAPVRHSGPDEPRS